MTSLQQCDISVADVSGSSFGLGFESGYLLGATAKKVILLYRLDLERKVSLLITCNTHSNCTLAPYSTVWEVEALSDMDFVSKVAERRSARSPKVNPAIEHRIAAPRCDIRTCSASKLGQ